MKKQVKKPASRTKKVDGKDHAAAKRAPKSIDEIMGFVNTKYFTDKAEIYREHLERQNTYDLQHECIKNELTPLQDRNEMTRRLMKQFEQYTNSLAAAQEIPYAPVVEKDKMQKALDVLKSRMSLA